MSHQEQQEESTQTIDTQIPGRLVFHKCHNFSIIMYGDRGMDDIVRLERLRYEQANPAAPLSTPSLSSTAASTITQGQAQSLRGPSDVASVREPPPFTSENPPQATPSGSRGRRGKGKAKAVVPPTPVSLSGEKQPGNPEEDLVHV